MRTISMGIAATLLGAVLLPLPASADMYGPAAKRDRVEHVHDKGPIGYGVRYSRGGYRYHAPRGYRMSRSYHARRVYYGPRFGQGPRRGFGYGYRAAYAPPPAYYARRASFRYGYRPPRFGHHHRYHYGYRYGALSYGHVPLAVQYQAAPVLLAYPPAFRPGLLSLLAGGYPGYGYAGGYAHSYGYGYAPAYRGYAGYSWTGCAC